MIYLWEAVSHSMTASVCHCTRLCGTSLDRYRYFLKIVTSPIRTQMALNIHIRSQFYCLISSKIFCLFPFGRYLCKQSKNARITSSLVRTNERDSVERHEGTYRIFETCMGSNHWQIKAALTDAITLCITPKSKPIYLTHSVHRFCCIGIVAFLSVCLNYSCSYIEIVRFMRRKKIASTSGDIESILVSTFGVVIISFVCSITSCCYCCCLQLNI